MQVIDDPGTDNLLLVMEYIDGGTLEQPAKSEGTWECIPEKLVQKHVRDICRVWLPICLGGCPSDGALDRWMHGIPLAAQW